MVTTFQMFSYTFYEFFELFLPLTEWTEKIFFPNGKEKKESKKAEEDFDDGVENKFSSHFLKQLWFEIFRSRISPIENSENILCETNVEEFDVNCISYTKLSVTAYFMSKLRKITMSNLVVLD